MKESLKNQRDLYINVYDCALKRWNNASKDKSFESILRCHGEKATAKMALGFISPLSINPKPH